MDFAKKIGPFPLGVWVAVIAGALGIAYYVNKGSAAAGTAALPDVGSESGIGGSTPGFVPVTTPVPSTPSGPLDNESWAFQAVAFLIGAGYGAVEAGTAVRKYIDSEPLTSRELTLINVVSKKAPDGIGPPPQIPTSGGLIPDPVTPPPVVTPPPAAVPARTFTVTRWPLPGSSLSSIAQIVYGQASKWPIIYNANRDKIRNPDLIQPGWVLRIP